MENKKIRVAIMSHELDVRPERTLYFRRLIEGLLEEREIDLTLVHFKAMPDDALYSRTREIVVPRIPLPVGSRFVSFLWFCLSTHDRFDIVHWLKPRMFPFFWLFPAKHVIVMAHGGGDVLVPGIWTLARRIFNWTIILFQKRIDALIAVSEYANKEIVYAYRVPSEKVVTIYNAVDPLYLAPIDEEFDRRARAEHRIENVSYFLSISRFRLHKNIGRILTGYLRYRSENPEAREHLVLGGGTMQEFEKTYGEISPSPFMKDVHFLGYILAEHLPALYRGATAYVFISLNEGFGLPIVEAMACGTPVIASSVTSLPEITGDAGIIVNPKDSEALAFALERLQDADLRKTLVERGKRRAQFFTWEKTIQKTVALYQQVLTGKMPLASRQISASISA